MYRCVSSPVVARAKSQQGPFKFLGGGGGEGHGTVMPGRSTLVVVNGAKGCDNWGW